ncbi:hypothetical protein ID866_4698 [Astraeus odoratus]|nr:hypothetical protein ID866_4698 [Astraeus odoratus]
MFARVLFSRSTAASAALKTQFVARPLRTLTHDLASCSRGTPLPSRRTFSLACALRQDVMQGDKTSGKGEPLRPPSGSVFIGNVPFSVTAEQLQEAFSQFGRVRGVSLLNTNLGTPRGAGFVEFETAQEAAAFVEADQEDPIFLLDRDLVVVHADIKINPTRLPSDTLVAQHFDVGSEDLIRNIFSEYADKLVDIRIPDKADRNGNVFIQFKTVDTATHALHALNARMVPETGRLLRLQYSRARPFRTKPEQQSLASRLSQRSRSRSEGTGF